MSNFPFPLTLLITIIALTVLVYLAKRLPWFGILAGLGLVSTAVHYWQNTAAKDFRTDGSAAGGFLMIFFGLFEVLLVVAGVSLICIAVASLGIGYTRKVKELRALRELEAPAELFEISTQRDPAAATGSLHQAAPMRESGNIAATLRPLDLPVSASKPVLKAPWIDRFVSAPPAADTPQKISSAAKWFLLIIGGIFAFAGLRLVWGLSNDLLCGRRSCIDVLGLLAWVKAVGGPPMLGLSYLVLASVFFFVAYRSLFPPP